jgi:hypothetical protein
MRTFLPNPGERRESLNVLSLGAFNVFRLVSHQIISSGAATGTRFALELRIGGMSISLIVAAES